MTDKRVIEGVRRFLMRYLFLASIGPVQDFIASARRTRDLFFGSILLSELSKAAAKALREHGGTLIFPDPQSNGELERGSALNVANKLVAIIDRDPDQTGWEVWGAIDALLQEIAGGVFIQIGNSSAFDRTSAGKQVKDLIEYVWAALPLAEKSDYATVRRLVESLLAARKNTRDFQPVDWGSAQPKSSIDGQFESVISESAYPSRTQSAQVNQQRLRTLYSRFHAGPAEHLSGIDLLKRLGTITAGGAFSVLSTSHIAALPYLERLEKLTEQGKEEATKKWFAYLSAVRAIVEAHEDSSSALLSDVLEKVRGFPKHAILGDYDGALLFEDRLLDVVVSTEALGQFKSAQKALEDFFTIADAELGKGRPTGYYAILSADGDGMGKVIDEQSRSDYLRHQQLSKALDSFAKSVKTVVEKFGGALIYAGGDDVLAFLPLHTVLACASELATTYSRNVADFKDKDGRSSTLSVGIAVVHHLSLLRDALDVARKAEGRAKAVPQKNALAITVSKRSGEEYAIEGQREDQAAIMEKLIDFCATDALSHGTAYELRDLVQRLTDLIDTSRPERMKDLSNVILKDTERILKRKLTVPAEKVKRMGKARLKEVVDVLRVRLGLSPGWMKAETPLPEEAGTESEKPRTIGVVPIEDFINELLVAEVLADAQKLANPPEKNMNISAEISQEGAAQ